MGLFDVTLDPKSSEVSEREFAAFLGVPPGHTLRCIRYALTGMDQSEWEHEECDAAGNVTARYKTSFGIGGGGASITCQKCSPDGANVGNVPISIDAFLTAHAKRR